MNVIIIDDIVYEIKITSRTTCGYCKLKDFCKNHSIGVCLAETFSNDKNNYHIY